MKLSLASTPGQNAINGYGSGYVTVNRRPYDASLIVMPAHIQEAWAPGGFDGLTEDDFHQLAALEPEIVLLGTGSRLRFPRPELTRALTEARIGLEVMDLQAACRTYAILVAEGRKVAAALLID